MALDHGWWVVFGTALVLLVVGIIDDRVDLGANARMLIQIGAALALVYLGDFRVETLGALGELGRYSVPFTLLVVVSFLNACNMVDGGDGLLGAVLLPPLVAAALMASAPLSLGAGLFAAVVLGFLVLNWPARSGRRSRLRVFMGNGGVLFIASLHGGRADPRVRGRRPVPAGRRCAADAHPTDGPGHHLRAPHRAPRVAAVGRPRAHPSPAAVEGPVPDANREIYFGLTTAATLTAVLLPRTGADDIWLWTIAALILTTATMLEIWRTTRARVRARAEIHAHPAEPCADESASAHPLVSRTHQHPLPDKLFQRTGTGG